MAAHNTKRRYSLLIEFDATSEQEAALVLKKVDANLSIFRRAFPETCLEITGPYDVSDESPKPMHPYG